MAVAQPNSLAAPEPASTRNAAFDAAFKAVTGPASLDITTAQFDAALEKLRALLPAGDEARDARFRSIYCGASRWEDPAAGLAYSVQAQELARKVRDLASEARARLCEAGYLAWTEGGQRGLAKLHEVVALLEKAQEPQLLAEALEMRGDLLSLLGEQAKAMLDFQRARAGYRGAGVEHEVESLQLSIAVAYRRIGDFPQAQRQFEAALERMQAKGDWESVGNNLIQLGFLHAETGALEKSLEMFRRAETIAQTHADRYHLNAARLGLAESQIALGKPDAALATLQLARSGFAADNDESSEDMLRLLTGQALAGLGQHAQALERYASALPLIERNGNERYLSQLFKAQATSLEALGKDAAALKAYKRHARLETDLHRKMQLQQSRLLEYEYEAAHREFENKRLRAEAEGRQQQLAALEAMRRLQWLAIALGAMLVALLAALAWRQWRKSARLRDLALQDVLTGVANRPGIELEADRALADAAREDKPVSLLILDLDHFKSVNDRYGHAAGDKVLRAAAAAWLAQLRGRDPLGRYGGEEFVVICKDTALAEAMRVAERLREATLALRFDDIDPALRVSVSIGVAQARASGETRCSLIDAADAALYRAKQAGRDRTEG